jgi:uncharacterized protein (DUF2062 family)
MTTAAAGGIVHAMASQRRVRRKLVEWLLRYGPLEIGGWTAQLMAAGVTYAWTASLAAAAAAATIGSSIGYYLPAYVRATRWANAVECRRTRLGRTCAVQLRALRSLTVEFGPAETIDSLLIRPATMYAVPALLGDVLLGWIVGGVVADLAFYVLAICSYEKFTGLLARRPRREEVPGGSLPSVSIA